jgi:hypothetical protein
MLADVELQTVFSFLHGIELFQSASLVCRQWNKILSDETSQLYKHEFNRCFFDSLPTEDEVKEIETKKNSYRKLLADALAKRKCRNVCHQKLTIENCFAEEKQLRCSCVADRRPTKLTIVSLDTDRCPEISFAFEEFAMAREFLESKFEANFIWVPQVSEEILQNADVVIIGTNDSEEVLSAEERTAIRNFVHNGGSLMLNGFSRWSVNGNFGRDDIAPWGLTSQIQSPFLSYQTHQVEEKLFSPDSPARMIVNGPYGQVETIANRGESVIAMNSQAEGLGCIPLTLTKNTNFFYYPPHETTGRKGQGLIYTNLHWCASPDAWDGGMFLHPPNTSLFHNFVTYAIVLKRRHFKA